MRRRPFLHLSAGVLATAGYVGAADSSPTPRSDDTQSDSRDATRVGMADDGSSLVIERVETPAYVVRLNDLGGDPNGRVTPFADLSERERRVFRTAIEDSFRSRDPPEWLVRFASATPVVERDGTYYRLEHTLPTYRITAETVPASDVSGRIATYDEYETAVTREDYVLSGLLGAARREGVELTYVWSDLREFLDAYDAVRYRGDVVDFSVDIEDSGPPYELSASRAPVSAVTRGAVWNADDASAEVRTLVRRAGHASGTYGFDSAPADLLDRLQSHEYVYLDGTFYAAYVEKRGPVPVSMSAAVRDGRVRLALRNDGETDLRISSGPPRPFGVVRCRPKSEAKAGEDSSGHLLWTDAYARSDRVRTVGREVRRIEDVALISTVAPGESLRESYAVPADLPPGEYVVSDSLSVRNGEGEADSSTVQYRITFSVS